MAKLGGDLQAAPQDVFATSVTPQAGLGSRISTPDGRVYRYAQVDSSTSLTPGNLLQGVVPVANHVHCAVTTAAAVGATSVTVTLGATAATQSYYTNGVASVDAGASTHLGYTYGIVSNTSAASSGTIVVNLSEPLQTNLTTSDFITLSPNQYGNGTQGVVANPTTKTNGPVGVAVTNASAAYYCWIQTRGLCATLSDASAVAVGLPVATSVITAGSVGSSQGTGVVVGIAASAMTSARTTPVFLTLE